MSDEKIQCPCGSLILQKNLSTHLKTKKHQKAQLEASEKGADFPSEMQGSIVEVKKGGKKSRKPKHDDSGSDFEYSDADDEKGQPRGKRETSEILEDIYDLMINAYRDGMVDCGDDDDLDEEDEEESEEEEAPKARPSGRRKGHPKVEAKEEEKKVE